MNSFSAIICQWDSPADFAADIGVASGHAAVMKSRNKIPDRYWKKTVEAAQRRGYRDITLELLADLAQREEAA